jgi:hypothetical protein
MGDPQPIHDALGADPLLLTPEEAVHLLRADSRTTIRQRPHARVDAGPAALRIQRDLIAGPEGSR